jgi:hypothetical protein
LVPDLDADLALNQDAVLVPDLKPNQLVHGFNFSKSGPGQKLFRAATLVKTCIGFGSDTSNYGSSKKFRIQKLFQVSYDKYVATPRYAAWWGVAILRYAT